MVIAHGDRPAASTEFDHAVEEVEAAASLGDARVLTYAAGKGGPNAEQRTRLGNIESYAKGELKHAVLTDSAVIRSILRAMSWLSTGKSPSYPPSELRKAVEELGLNPSEYPAVDRLLAEVCDVGGFPPLPRLTGD